MKKFQYKTVVKNHDHRPDSLSERDMLNEEGNEGWELVSVLSTAPTTTLNKTIYYFKREKV